MFHMGEWKVCGQNIQKTNILSLPLLVINNFTVVVFATGFYFYVC